MRTIASVSLTLLMLITQIGLMLFLPSVVPAISSQPGEKLILGFEQAELIRGAYISREEKTGRDSWFYLLEQTEGFDFAARFE